MNTKSILTEYCCGCGLCKSIFNIEFENKEGFDYPMLDTENCSRLVNICPATMAKHRDETAPVCGLYENVYLGYSQDSLVRELGSSGGVLTSLAIYMLERKLIDGVLHVKGSRTEPWKTQTVCSRSKEEIISCCGSRYAQSSTLNTIGQYLDGDEKLLVIGKPCDIRVLRNYSKIESRVDKVFPYMFSFFCMGVPSEKANIKLIETLGVSPADCVSLKYRGDGWPGYTIVRDKNGDSNTMSYNESWGGILGRDLRKYCKFCMDGFGDAADISCGDAWYLDQQKKPVFEENAGRNVVFARDEKGSSIIDRAIKDGCIKCNPYDNIEELRFIQKSQYARKELMQYRQLAMMMLVKNGPRYKFKYLKQYSQNVPIAKKVDTFAGTVSRILKGKL